MGNETLQHGRYGSVLFLEEIGDGIGFRGHLMLVTCVRIWTPSWSSRVISYLGDAAGEGSIDVELLVSEIIKHAPQAEQVVMNSVERLREGMAILGSLSAAAESGGAQSS